MSTFPLDRSFTSVVVDISDVVVHLGDGISPYARWVQELAQHMIDEQVSDRVGYKVTGVEMVTGRDTIRPKRTEVFKVVWVDDDEG